jgi:tetratricopeptide (TPR) repeat protein
MQKYREAIALLETLIEEDPEDSTLWLLQANAYIGSEQPRAAAANLEAVRMLGKARSSTLVLLGDIYMNEGVPELAKEAYLEVIRSDEKGTRFQTAERAARLMVRTRAWGEAQEILRTIDRQYTEGLTDEQELEVLELKAQVARAQGRTKEAADLLQTIVRRDGTRGEALLALAAYHREQGDDAKAIFLLERAEKLPDFEYRALLEHAQIMVAGRDYRKAAELLRAALQLQNEPRVERFLARVEQAIPPQ